MHFRRLVSRARQLFNARAINQKRCSALEQKLWLLICIICRVVVSYCAIMKQIAGDFFPFSCRQVVEWASGVWTEAVPQVSGLSCFVWCERFRGFVSESGSKGITSLWLWGEALCSGCISTKILINRGFSWGSLKCHSAPQSSSGRLSISAAVVTKPLFELILFIN